MQHISRFTDYDIHLFKEGNHTKLYDKLGSHEMEVDGVEGTYFAVWAPNAQDVSVIGDFNGWNKQSNPLKIRWDASGIWEGFIPKVGRGTVYKYAILPNHSDQYLEKSDLFARRWEIPPRTASIVWDTYYEWKDEVWMQKRLADAGKPKPQSVYEVHLGSWKRKSAAEDDWFSYAELVDHLVPYVKEMGFTHVELLPIMEHPFYGSWGYQTLGYFAASSRYGSPEDLMLLIEAFHKEGIGVILDWVPSHFPEDAHGLARYDGTALYEHEDPRLGYHPDWKSLIFNYGRNEVRSFLISSAMFWLDRYHIDGIRVDAVASMLYLDYSRKEGEWIPNKYGGNENLDAIHFLKSLNEAVYKEFPDVDMVAEESTSWPGVSRPTYMDGLGFGQKWMMGWMHDTLKYLQQDTIYRGYHQDQITFSLTYAFSENFMLPLSHDEVVHGKGSLISRMPGDNWKQFANMRLLYGYMFTHPGSQLIFMGGEFGQLGEWKHTRSLDWHLLDQEPHQKLKNWLAALNDYYKARPALYQYGFQQRGFEWVAYNDSQNSVIIYLRKGDDEHKTQLVVCHFTPTVIHDYQIGVPEAGTWKEVLNSDNLAWGGSDVLNIEPIETVDGAFHGQEQSIKITIAPLAIQCFEIVTK